MQLLYRAITQLAKCEMEIPIIVAQRVQKATLKMCSGTITNYLLAAYSKYHNIKVISLLSVTFGLGYGIV